MTQALTLLGTSEGLHLAHSLILHARNRFIVNLLPLLQQAHGLRRVITVAAGGKEGPIDANDFEGRSREIGVGKGCKGFHHVLDENGFCSHWTVHLHPDRGVR